MESAPEDRRERVALKFALLEAASTDDRMSSGEFRFFARILQSLDRATWTATLGDERIMAEVPGCASRHTCNGHRAAIAALGYFEFEAGSGRHPTRYFIAEKPPAEAEKRLTARRDALQVRRTLRRAKPPSKTRDVVARPPLNTLNETWSHDHLRRGHTTTRSLSSSPDSLPVQEMSQSAHAREEPASQPDQIMCYVCDEERPADLSRKPDNVLGMKKILCTECGAWWDERQKSERETQARSILR